MTSKRYALIISNGEFQDERLQQIVFPSDDIQDLAETLLDPAVGSFDEVDVVTNGSGNDIRRAIASFFHSKKRGDLLVLYYLGYGLLDRYDRLFFAVQDTDLDLLNATAIPATFIAYEMDYNCLQHQVVILDCLNGGELDESKIGMVSNLGTSMIFRGTGYGRVVLTADNSTQFSWKRQQIFGQARGSLFTHYFVEGLRTGKADMNGDGLVSLDELFDYVSLNMGRDTLKQTPKMWSFKRREKIIMGYNSTGHHTGAIIDAGHLNEALTHLESVDLPSMVAELLDLMEKKSSFYVKPHIPENKVVETIDAFKAGIAKEDVLILYYIDFPLMKLADKLDKNAGKSNIYGFFLTSTAIYWRQIGNNVCKVSFKDLQRLSFLPGKSSLVSSQEGLRGWHSNAKLLVDDCEIIVDSINSDLVGEILVRIIAYLTKNASVAPACLESDVC